MGIGITEALHEYMLEKLNDSLETENEKKIRYVNKRKTRITKEPTDKPAKIRKKTVTVVVPRTGHDNKNARHGARNAQNAKRLDISQTVAGQVEK